MSNYNISLFVSCSGSGVLNIRKDHIGGMPSGWDRHLPQDPQGEAWHVFPFHSFPQTLEMLTGRNVEKNGNIGKPSQTRHRCVLCQADHPAGYTYNDIGSGIQRNKNQDIAFAAAINSAPSQDHQEDHVQRECDPKDWWWKAKAHASQVSKVALGWNVHGTFLFNRGNCRMKTMIVLRVCHISLKPKKTVNIIEIVDPKSENENTLQSKWDKRWLCFWMFLGLLKILKRPSPTLFPSHRALWMRTIPSLPGPWRPMSRSRSWWWPPPVAVPKPHLRNGPVAGSCASKANLENPERYESTNQRNRSWRCSTYILDHIGIHVLIWFIKN